MSIANKIESISNHLENAYNSLEDIGVDLTNVNKNIENLSVQIESVYNDLPKVTDEDVEIVLSPTKKGKMELILKGNTEQFTTTGKNLLSTINANKTYKQTTINVLKSIFHDTTNYTGTGEYAVAFSFTDAIQYGNYGNYVVPAGNKITLDAGTYTYSYKKISGTAPTYSDASKSRSIAVSKVTNTPYTSLASTRIVGDTASVTFTLEEETTISLIYGYYFMGQNVTSDIYFTLQLEKNTISTEWEPYTGGIASPNPNYPQDIEVVTGDNTINVFGKNLYSRDNGQYNVPVYATDGTSASYQDVNVVWIKVTPNTDYSFTLQPNSTSYYVRIIQCDSNKGFIVKETQLNSSSSQIVTATKTLGSNCEWLQIAINQHQVSQIAQNNWEVMIEESSIPTTYEEYKSASYPINLGTENLWKNQLSGFLPQNGSYPTTVSSYPNARYVLVNLLTGQSITFSGSTSNFGRVRYIDKDTNQVVGMVNKEENEFYKSTSTFVAGFTEGTITAKKEVIIGIMDMSGVENNLVVNYGTTPQTVTNNPIELCKKGTYQDYIYKSNGNWYKHSVINKIVLDGINYLLYGNGGSANDYWEYNRTGVTGGIGTQDSVKTNYFNQTTNSRVVILSNGGLYLRFPKNMGIDISTNTLLNNWFLTHNTEIYYVLYTPTNIEITDPILIQQLENIYSSVKSYNNQTNIYQTNSNLPFIIEASALKKND